MGKFVNVTVAVALSNVNLRSGPGGIRYRIPRALHDVGTGRPGYVGTCGTTFFGDGGRGGQRGWVFATYVFGEVKCRSEC